MSDVRVAVVGTGILGRRHARVFHEIEGAALVAVANHSREKAEAIGAMYGVPSYVEVERMLSEVPCDAVAVATPDHLHFDPVMTALAHEKHVLVEKPLATSLPQARAMVEEAGRRERVLKVNYSQRYVSEYAWIREQLKRGVIGRPGMAISVKHDTLYVPTRMISWAAQTSPLFFMSSHDLDLMAWFLDSQARRVVAHERRGVLEAQGVNVHDGIDALITYENGVAASFHSSWMHPNSYPHISTDRMTIMGEDGMIHFEGRERQIECYAQAGGTHITFTGPRTADEVEGRIEGAFTRSLEDFLRCVRTGSESETSAARTLHVTETQVAILEAIAASGPVLLSGSPPIS